MSLEGLATAAIIIGSWADKRDPGRRTSATDLQYADPPLSVWTFECEEAKSRVTGQERGEAERKSPSAGCVGGKADASPSQGGKIDLTTGASARDYGVNGRDEDRPGSKATENHTQG